jgi:hypothetical protein
METLICELTTPSQHLMTEQENDHDVIRETGTLSSKNHTS